MKNDKTEPSKQPSAPSQNGVNTKTGKKATVIKGIKQGFGQVSRSDEYISRVATLLVMIVTTINTATLMVTSFIQGNYWQGGVQAFLLVFLHLPVIGILTWLLCKARVQAVYSKIRPLKPGEATTGADDEAVMYNEIGEMQKTASDKNKEKKTNLKNKISEQIKQLELQAKAARRGNATGQTKKAFIF